MNGWFAALWISFQAPVAEPIPVYGPTPLCLKTCSVSQDGLALVRRWEGFAPVPYKDVAGKLTVGVGHLILPHETFDRVLTPDDGDALLKKDAAKTVAGINRVVAVRLKQQQFDALASFSFNVGTGALASSTLLKRVNAERHADVPAEFMKWVFAGGSIVPGLVARRKDEGVKYAS